jgi:ABC-type sugar transport system substrate-binding protein
MRTARVRENVGMGDERLRSEIREEQERIISAVRSAGDHWEMAKAEDSFANLLERMADELEVGSAHDRGRFLAAAQALRKSAAVNEERYVAGLGGSAEDS